MNKIMTLLSAIAIIFTGCGNIQNTETVEISQDILFISMYSNYAWGFQSYGSFIDNNGNFYEFDFSGEKAITSDKEYLDKVKEIMQNEEPKYVAFDTDELQYLYKLLYQIDENAEFIEENVSYDAGQNSLYGVKCNSDGSEKFVMINSKGDWNRTPTDKNAKELVKYYHKNIMN